ncbi:hypothetical protein NKR23_g9528 [Pleurostoma richardsiae]|uniref:Uncharacterized protein n=1 Tax=Pleurostoma richardsiae TaxID=41990 RepID=A0AA38RQ22_9PEZI|nr:hypothetical protein NKR23_g9528 [Pleurostoma richardsiae]
MAILPAPQPAEDLAPALAARQGGMVLTQVITRPFTTYTYLVTLGDATTVPTTAAPTSASTTAVVAPAPTTSGSGGLSQAEIGAILGSVVAFVLIVLLIWYCMSLRAQAAYRVAALETDSYTTVYSSETTIVRDPWAREGQPRPYQQDGPTLNPPPQRFPPTPIPPTYRATANPQIRGVRRYP